jgi:hypothetical protein
MIEGSVVTFLGERGEFCVCGCVFLLRGAFLQLLIRLSGSKNVWSKFDPLESTHGKKALSRKQI